jgi:hypothetical protein
MNYNNQIVTYNNEESNYYQQSNENEEYEENEQNEEYDERKMMFSDDNKEFTDFKNNVKEWLSLDDDIKTLQNAMAQRKKRKNELTPGILDFMKTYEISDLNTQGGKLQYVKSTTTKGLNKKTIISRLADFFKDINKGEKAAQFIMEGRDKTEVFRLKRVVNKRIIDTVTI